MAKKKNIVTMRNEDGTQYYTNFDSWSSDPSEAIPVSPEVFALMKEQVAASRKNDCPDNGFFGVYNLKHHVDAMETDISDHPFSGRGMSAGDY